MKAMKPDLLLIPILAFAWTACGGGLGQDNNSEQGWDEYTTEEGELASGSSEVVPEQGDASSDEGSEGSIGDVASVRLCYSNTISSGNGSCEWQGPLTTRALRWCNARGARALTGKRFDTVNCGWFRAKSLFFTCC